MRRNRFAPQPQPRRRGGNEDPRHHPQRQGRAGAGRKVLKERGVAAAARRALGREDPRRLPRAGGGPARLREPGHPRRRRAGRGRRVPGLAGRLPLGAGEGAGGRGEEGRREEGGQARRHGHRALATTRMRQVEEHVRASGLAFTFLHPTWFMQNFTTSHGRRRSRPARWPSRPPTGRPPSSTPATSRRWRPRRSSTPGHDGKTYTLTGARAALPRRGGGDPGEGAGADGRLPAGHRRAVPRRGEGAPHAELHRAALAPLRGGPRRPDRGDGPTRCSRCWGARPSPSPGSRRTTGPPGRDRGPGAPGLRNPWSDRKTAPLGDPTG